MGNSIWGTLNKLFWSISSERAKSVNKVSDNNNHNIIHQHFPVLNNICSIATIILATKNANIGLRGVRFVFPQPSLYIVHYYWYYTFLSLFLSSFFTRPFFIGGYRNFAMWIHLMNPMFSKCFDVRVQDQLYNRINQSTTTTIDCMVLGCNSYTF